MYSMKGQHNHSTTNKYYRYKLNSHVMATQMEKGTIVENGPESWERGWMTMENGGNGQCKALLPRQITNRSVNQCIHILPDPPMDVTAL